MEESPVLGLIKKRDSLEFTLAVAFAIPRVYPERQEFDRLRAMNEAVVAQMELEFAKKRERGLVSELQED